MAAVGTQPTIERWQKYKAQNEALKSEFSQYESIFRDIRDYLAPRTARFNGENTGQPKREDLKIINSAPRFAVRTLSAGLQSGVTNPSRPWFRLGTQDPELQASPRVKAWLFHVEEVLREIFLKSNFYDRVKSAYGTMGTYGTSAIFMDEDDDDLMRLYDFPIGSFRLATSHTNRVNTMFRDVSFTTLQYINKFGDKSPQAVKDAYSRGNYYHRWNVIHIVEPNDQYQLGSALAERKKFASVWFDPSRSGEESILKYSGYDYNPLFGPRWDILGEDTYGIGCGEFCLGDSKGIQLMEKRKLQIIDKVANPTMVADASMRNQRTTMLPGDTTYVNGLITGNQGYRPAYQIANPHLADMRVEIEAIESRIDEAFYKNLFMTILDIGDQPDISATQINSLKEEKLLMLGPVLERLNDELLEPAIDAAFALAWSRGKIAPPPEELQGVALRIEYISILAQAQKAIGLGNIERFMTFTANVAATVDPRAKNKFNSYEAIDAYADAVAVPPKLIRTNDEADGIAQAEAQQAQQMAMMENAKNLSGAAKDMGEIGQQYGGNNAAALQAMQAAGVVGAAPQQ